MNKEKFAVLFNCDERMIYAQEYLKKHGYEIVEDKDSADYILLPIPAKAHMFDGLEGKKVFYGCGDFDGYDYNKNEVFLQKNAYLTAEGAIALYKESSDKAIFGSKSLITGYGRIAKALHRALLALGSDVSICARSEINKTEAEFNSARILSFEELKEKNDFDIIFNTVPHIIFTKDELDALKSEAVLIDLASFPGGVDTLYANAKNIKLINGSRLPSRYSKKSAGFLIGEAVTQMIKEGLS